MRRTSPVVMGLLALGLLSGCAASRTLGWNQSGEGSSLSADAQQKLMNEGKARWAKRLDRAELVAALDTFEKVARANPEHYESHAYLTRGYYFLADGHTPDSQMDEKKRLWEIGLSWGEKAMVTNAAFRKKVKEEKVAPEDALDLLDAKYADSIYWTASNLGKWAKNSSITTALKFKGRAKKMIERVQAIDPKFFYGAPDRYWGVYYSALPKMFGGSLEKSDEHFQKSLKVAPNYLGTTVLVADNLCRKRSDRECFKKALNVVLQAKSDVIPELTPENTLEQKKARDLLAKEAEIFD